MTKRQKKTEATTGRIDIRKGYSERDANGVVTAYAPGLYLLDPELSERLIAEGIAVPEGYVEPEPTPEPIVPDAPTGDTPPEAEAAEE